ncbi:MAG: hypothetical protein JWM80_4791 [Cyanobacteria bacterium RYN_339]|nr:hypothetical protein [Cyanobacteria bacterium RYN_339]
MINPTMLAVDLDNQTTSIVEMLEKQFIKKKLRSQSRIHDRAGIANVILCAAAAEAIDRHLGRTLVRVTGMGKAIAPEGPSLVVSRYIFRESRPPNWPSIQLAKEPLAAPDGQIDVYAEFSDHLDPAIAYMTTQPWFRETTEGAGGTLIVHLNSAVLAGMVRVIGLLAPAIPETGPGALAPTLGGIGPEITNDEAPPSPDAVGVWCVVANVTKYQEYGLDHEIRLGTKHFSPNTKVYCFPPLWGDGYVDIKVIGRHRGSPRLATLIMPKKRLTNWRVKMVYHPHVVRELGEYRWQQQDAETMVASILFWDAAREAKRHGLDAAAPEVALMTAVLFKLPDEIERALDRGADIDACWNGWTPLTAAATFATAPIVELLIEHGANRTAANSFGTTAAEAARRHWHNEVLAVIERAESPGILGILRKWWEILRGASGDY